MTRFSASVYPGSFDHRHPLPQHGRRPAGAGRRRHEERLGQVEPHVEIAVAEGGAGRRVERLEQRRGGAAGFVEAADLVEDEHRVAAADAPQLLDDPSGRARAGAVQRRRRAKPAAGQPGARPPECGRELPRQRRFADSARARQSEHRRRDVRVRQAHGDVVDEALLHRAVRRMPRVEDRPHPRAKSSGARVRTVQGRLTRHRRYSPARACSGSLGPHADICSRTCRPRTRTAGGSAGASNWRRRRSSPSVWPSSGSPRNLRSCRAVMRFADERRLAGLQPERHLAADRLQTAGELADPPLAGVVADDPPAGACGEPEWRGRQSGRPVLRAD